MSSSYHPISCEFHDVLEALATTGRTARIRFTAADGVVQDRDTVIRDVFSRMGAEYAALGSGETVRLDQLVAIDQVRLADFPR